MKNETAHKNNHILLWGVLGSFLIAASAWLRLSSSLFGYDVDIDEMPIVLFVAVYCTLTLFISFIIPYLIRRTKNIYVPSIFALVVFVGVAARLIQFGTESVLEDDYHRYLWDGAVTSTGINPFLYSPSEVVDGSVSDPNVIALKNQAGIVLERVNHPDLRTVYPPVTQASFALANFIDPFNLDAWRTILLLLELGCLTVIVLMLSMLNQSILWSALYWWNPVVIKEVANSAHMEPVLMLPVLIASYLALRGKSIKSSFFLAIAAGVKVWPVILTIAIAYKELREPRKVIAIFAVFSVVSFIMFWPIFAAGLDQSSGFVAFAQNWNASSAAYLVSDFLITHLMPFTETQSIFSVLTRAVLGAAMICYIALYWFRCKETQQVVLHRFFIIIVALYLLSPSQTPWYFLWISPFLCFYPVRGLQLAGVLIPLHYMYFYFAVRDQELAYHDGIVWVIWLPVWALLIYDEIQLRRNALTKKKLYNAS